MYECINYLFCEFNNLASFNRLTNDATVQLYVWLGVSRGDGSRQLNMLLKRDQYNEYWIFLNKYYDQSLRINRVNWYFISLQAFPVMTGEMSNEGDLQAPFIHQLTDSMRFKCVAQVISRYSKLKC